MTLNALPQTAPTGDPDQQQQQPQIGSRTTSFILSCPYCQWTTLDIDLTFDKAVNLTEQIQNHDRKSSSQSIARTSAPRPSQAQPSSPFPPSSQPATTSQSSDSRFALLKSHLQYQLTNSNSSSQNPLLTPSGSANYDSPSSLARIMALYTNNSLTPLYGKKSNARNSIMREAADTSEGLKVFDPEEDCATARKLKEVGWEGTSSPEQRREQFLFPNNDHSSQFCDDLRPIPMLMRTKKARRCRACKHILVKPEAKISSTRYRIRLIAGNTLPGIALKPLSPFPNIPLPGPQSFSSRPLPLNQPLQFLLTLKNPLFEKVNVSLAAPSMLPVNSSSSSSALSNDQYRNENTAKGSGRFTHNITLLCPTFSIGANTDAWDEALSKDPVVGTSAKDKRASAMLDSAAAAASLSAGDGGGGHGAGGKKVAEAGKIWERGRNWTSVVLETVSRRKEGRGGEGGDVGADGSVAKHPENNNEDDDGEDDSDEDEDEDILEIPIFVRMEWEVDASGGSTTGGAEGSLDPGEKRAIGGGGGGDGNGGSGKEKEKRELGYWMVVGVGRVG